MEYNDLLEKVKNLLFSSIQSKMDSPSMLGLRQFLNVKEDYNPKDKQLFIEGRALLLPNAIERCISNVMALGNNDDIKGAVEEIYEMRSSPGDLNVSHEEAIGSLTYELNLCLKVFSFEVNLFSRMHKLLKSGMSNQEVWEQVHGSFHYHTRPRTEPDLKPEYAHLNDLFKSRIRARIENRLRSLQEKQRNQNFGTMPDFILGHILILADSNNLAAAAEKIYEIKLRDPENAGTLFQTIETLTKISEMFPTETSILRRLYEMMENNAACVEIVAEMEVMLLSDER